MAYAPGHAQEALRRHGGLAWAEACRKQFGTMHAQPSSFAARLEHTLLKADASRKAVTALCTEAVTHGFYGVCVNGVHVRACAQQLAGCDARVVTVVGFPLGASTTASKAFEAGDAIAQGADEVDMVLDIGRLREGDFGYVAADIAAVVQAASPHVVKVILETSALDAVHKRDACRLVQQAGAHFVKTSTGFGAGGAHIADIALMRAAVGPKMGIKASGGIRTRAFADALLEAGADRLGVSASVALVAAAHPPA